jgi:hypothetical protein
MGVDQVAEGQLCNDLEEIRLQLEAIKLRAANLLAGLTNDQVNWRPGPSRWSIGQAVDHLNVTAAIYVPTLDLVIRRAHDRKRFNRGPFRYGIVERWMVRSMEPPPRRRFRAPRSFLPMLSHSPETLLPAFLDWQDRIADRLKAANGLDLSRVKVWSPVLPLIRFSLGQTFALIAAHERRHLWQAEQVRALGSFPSVQHQGVPKENLETGKARA